ncbi:MAG: radical SAM family heme chaperone HemW [Sandaracinaceae bacterium]
MRSRSTPRADLLGSPRDGTAPGVQTSVYVHFPWCLKKCPYCDFASGAVRHDDVPHAAYADAVIAELTSRPMADRELVSVFFGGGTPSLWAPAQLGRVLCAVRGAFRAEAPGLEVTVECNPTSIDEDHVRALADVGVNRISIGVQSLDDGRLGFLGRLHDAEGALTALRGATAAMPRVSADLMFGMPDQLPRDFVEELERVLDTGVEHVSAYALTVEPGTQFGALRRLGRLPLASDDDYADTFLAAEAAFSARGFLHYEVSNYAPAGKESRHNQHYWRGGDYLGLGAGAVGALSDGVTAVRRKNDPRPERYLDNPTGGTVYEETLNPADRVREALMLGLRTTEGVDLAGLASRTGRDPREGRERELVAALARGDLSEDAGRLTVPRSRWLRLDSIVTAIF